MDKFIIVDIETPYSFHPRDGIREVAAIVIENYIIVDKIHLAIITDYDEYKNGYGSGLEAIETNAELRNEFVDFINKYKYPLVAHYAPFEKRFLTYWNWVDENQEFYCSLKAIKNTICNLPKYNMKYLLSEFNIKNSQDHTAIQDVMDLFELIKIINPKQWEPINNIAYDYKPEHAKEYRHVDKQRLEDAKENMICNIFNNKTIVFTGEMTGSRTDMMEMAIKHGAKTTLAISKSTNLLVVGNNPGSKLQKAIEWDIKIISENDFINVVDRLDKNSLGFFSQLDYEQYAPVFNEGIIKDYINNIIDITQLPEQLKFTNSDILVVEKFKKHYSISLLEYLMFKLIIGKNKYILEIKPEYKDIISIECYTRKDGWLRFDIGSSGKLDDFKQSIYEILAFELNNPHGDLIGCCAHYEDCSNLRKCIEDDLLLSLSCQYRINLMHNFIFYGEKRNTKIFFRR